MAQTMMATFPYDACVAWECPRVFANPRIIERNPVRLVEMQCAHMLHADIDMTAEFATGVVSLSPWHAGFLELQGIPGPHYILPNGVDLEDYPYKKRQTLPRKKQFIYSSSPDRGLWHLLRLWPNIRDRWPDAELNIAYGLSNYLATRIWSHRRDGEMAVAMAALVHQPGINNVGKLSRLDLAKLQCESTVMAYPCDTIAPTETGCISVIEGMAAGLPVVTTDCDCLESEFGEVAVIVPLPILEHETAYFEALVSVLENKKVYTELSAAGREFAQERQWKDIAKEWLVMFEELHP
jgi:glycosyltransferase involved in cell wall biosynthesis